MNIFDRILYVILFLLNKYIATVRTEAWLNAFEARTIRRYLTVDRVPPTPVPTIDVADLNDQLFRELSGEYRGPVLIKGFFKDSKAVRDWDLEYLKDTIGDFQVNTMTFSDRLILAYMSFREFADRITTDLYINNNHTIFAKFPELFSDISPYIDKLKVVLTSCNLRNIHIANLFIGYNDSSKKCTGSSMHCGGSGNFFCMVRGKKQWTLIDPQYSCMLKGRVAQSGIHGQTLFEMGDADLNDYPEIYWRLPRHEFIMEPGDILWNPPWWWHRIKNENGLSIGVAVRNNKVTGLNFKNNALFTLSGWIYLWYNSWAIDLYERFFSSKNFGSSQKEDHQGNVLYQIEALLAKYPKSSKLQEIIA